MSICLNLFIYYSVPNYGSYNAAGSRRNGGGEACPARRGGAARGAGARGGLAAAAARPVPAARAPRRRAGMQEIKECLLRKFLSTELLVPMLSRLIVTGVLLNS